MDRSQLQDLIELIEQEKILEVTSYRVELKSDWSMNHGKDISAIANYHDFKGGWLIIGVNDVGKIVNRPNNETWLKDTEEKISNQIHQFLTPHWAIKNITGKIFAQGPILLLEIINPGDITEWNSKAYKLIGTVSTEMTPDESLSLAMKLPGEDFSKSEWKGETDGSLVLDFAQKLKSVDSSELPVDLSNVTPTEILKKLNIYETMTSKILFGNTPVRIIHYDNNGDVLDQEEKNGAYHIISDDFIANIQIWTRKQGTIIRGNTASAIEETPYPTKALREVLANAVAHSLYQRNNGEIIVDLYPTRLVVRNNCLLEAKAFYKQWFSTQTFVYNKLLMRLLRLVKITDELGSGKMRIFRQMMEAGKREPLIEFMELGKYGKWSITLFNEELNQHLFSLIERFKNTFQNTDEQRIATALVLWENSKWTEIQEKLDRYYNEVALKVIRSPYSPAIVVGNNLLMRRWARVALTGQKSKAFNENEENLIKSVLQSYANGNDREGHISTQEAKNIIGLSNTQSETVQLSNLFRKWAQQNIIKMVRRGHWQFLISSHNQLINVIMPTLETPTKK